MLTPPLPDPARCPPAGATKRCPACGAAVNGGLDGCQALFDELAGRAYSDPAYAGSYNLAFDTYCMQHLERYCLSAKSYAAHLTRLCCGLEYAGEARVYQAIQKWLNGPAKIEKLPAPAFHGQLTVADLRTAQNPTEHSRLVKAWAQNVWAAYAVQHTAARLWITAALQPAQRTLK